MNQSVRNKCEYQALRATIRERSTARVCLFAIGVAVWAGLLLTSVALALPPVSTLIPLIALAAAFEAVFALHVGVERIGRYLFVFHDDQWERVAGSSGPLKGGPRIDPLFAVPFLLAAVINLMPLLLTTPIVQELILVGGAHAAFAARVLSARAAAARQRSVDTARFAQSQEEMKREPS
jgi:hypothetical protein